MKLIPFFLLITVTCRAQSRPMYDTIPVLMLAADTSKLGCCVFYTPTRTWTMRGYEVREQRDHDKEPFVYYGPALYWKHIVFLTPDRKPTTYFVWDSKQLKQ